MTFRDANGNVLSKTQFLALTSVVPTPETQRKLTAPIFESYPLSGESEASFEAGKRLRYKSGTVLTDSQINAMFPAGSVASVVPTGSPVAAGGFPITINGTELSGCKGVLVGGVAATNVQVKSKSKITATAPAHAAGAVSVVVQDDGGDITKANAFTYV